MDVLYSCGTDWYYRRPRTIPIPQNNAFPAIPLRVKPLFRFR